MGVCTVWSHRHRRWMHAPGEPRSLVRPCESNLPSAIQPRQTSPSAPQRGVGRTDAMRIATTYARTGMFPDRVYASIRARALRPREHELADEPIHPYTLPVRAYAACLCAVRPVRAIFPPATVEGTTLASCAEIRMHDCAGRDNPPARPSRNGQHRAAHPRTAMYVEGVVRCTRQHAPLGVVASGRLGIRAPSAGVIRTAVALTEVHIVHGERVVGSGAGRGCARCHTDERALTGGSPVAPAFPPLWRSPCPNALTNDLLCTQQVPVVGCVHLFVAPYTGRTAQ